jgi:hypothetical protein
VAQLVYELRRHARILKSLQALPIVADMNCENSHPRRRAQHSRMTPVPGWCARGWVIAASSVLALRNSPDNVRDGSSLSDGPDA